MGDMWCDDRRNTEGGDVGNPDVRGGAVGGSAAKNEIKR